MHDSATVDAVCMNPATSVPMDMTPAPGAARYPVIAQNVVATSHPLAAQAGLQMLHLGGNAVDMALAAAIAMTVVEPVSTGLGSDSFALIWDDGRAFGLNGSGRAPKAWAPELVRSWPRMSSVGWNSVTVPGAVASWVDLSDRFGKLPFATLFSPAIEWAENGHPVAPGVAGRWSVQTELLREQPGFADTFMPYGRAPAAGEIFRNPALGRSLRLIAETRGKAFYEGALAEAMIAHSDAHGGLMSLSDLSEHRSEWVSPLQRGFADCMVHQTPPNGQGLVVLQALGILAELDLPSDPNSVEMLHLQIEAYKLAAADTARFIADGTEQKVVDALLNRAYLRSRAQLIKKQAQDFAPGLPQTGGTVFIAAADASGRAVAFIQSNYVGFGSGIVVPGTGISLHNRAAGFSLDPKHPNYAAPGRRPAHTILPALISRHGKPLMSLGVTGGNMQPQGQLQIALRILLGGCNPQAAIDAPRFRHMAGLDINVEEAMPEATKQGLAARGHRIKPLPPGYMDFGAAHVAYRLEDGWVAGADGRKDGAAVGW